MTEHTLSYEEARELLIEAVRQLEAGGTNLEESLQLWERAEKLADICESWLAGAATKFDEAVAKADRSAGDEGTSGAEDDPDAG